MSYVCFVKSGDQIFNLDEFTSIDDAKEFLTDQVVRDYYSLSDGDILVCMRVADFHIETFVLKENPRRVLFE